MKPDTKSAPVKAAWRKGLSAGMRGLDESHNPHLEEGQKIEDLKGWSRLYATTWHEGWVDGVAAKTERETH